MEYRFFTTIETNKHALNNSTVCQLKYKLTDENSTEQENPSIDSAENNLSVIVPSSLQLPDSLDHLQIENYLNEIIATSNIESFDSQVDYLEFGRK
ncbi:unnamed protein product [Rotaria magnacalcarata]